MLRQIVWSLFCFLLLAQSQALAASFSGRVVKITDGDTIQVFHEGQAVKVRLTEIDTPERGQPFGRKAKDFTASLVAGGEVRVEYEKKDRYKRILGAVFLPDGRSLNRELVAAGYAWWFRRYSGDVSLGVLEDQARLDRRGLWADPAPVAPWEW